MFPTQRLRNSHASSGSVLYLAVLVLLLLGLVLQFGYWRNQTVEVAAAEEAARHDLSQTHERNKALADTLSHCKESESSLLAAKTGLEREVAGLKVATYKQQNEVNELETRLENTKKTDVACQLQTAALQREITSLQGRLKDAIRESQEGKEEISRLQSQLQKAGDANKSTKGLLLECQRRAAEIIHDNTNVATPVANSATTGKDTTAKTVESDGMVDPFDIQAPDEKKSTVAESQEETNDANNSSTMDVSNPDEDDNVSHGATTSPPLLDDTSE